MVPIVILSEVERISRGLRADNGQHNTCLSISFCENNVHNV